MKQTRLMMGMPITLEVVDPGATEELLASIFAYFQSVDDRFSTYKEQSEISLINRHELSLDRSSPDMQNVLALAEEARLKTNGYFDIQRDGKIDPSGLVKGWAIFNAAEEIRRNGFKNYYVEAGGDFQVAGKNSRGQDWRVGIRSPYNLHDIVKVLAISERGVATSGTYIRGQHIYNPKAPGDSLTEVVSLTVIGPEILTADSYATAAFAMGKEGIAFIEDLPGYEGYQIDKDRRAIFTSGFTRYVLHE